MIDLSALPNAHLLLANFSAALLLAGTVFLMAGRLMRSQGAGQRAATAESLLHAGRWNVWVGAVLAVVFFVMSALVIAAAQLDPIAAALASLHLRMSVAAAGLAAAGAVVVWRVRRQAPGWIVLAVLLVSSGAATLSALAASQLVHRHGIERQREEPRMPVARLNERAGAFAPAPVSSSASGAVDQKRNSAPSDRNHTSSRPSMS